MTAEAVIISAILGGLLENVGAPIKLPFTNRFVARDKIDDRLPRLAIRARFNAHTQRGAQALGVAADADESDEPILGHLHRVAAQIPRRVETPENVLPGPV